MNTLKKSFSKRLTWINNRSSAIFPLDLNNGSDFCLMFLNYWKLKNNIKDLKCFVSLIYENGNTYQKKLFKIRQHNEISMSKDFKIKNFRGIANIEFKSKKNLRFPFPAVTGFYISPNGLISCVHSAGRFLNENEKSNKKQMFNETNFSLKFSKNKKITPFFSLFKYEDVKKDDFIKVTLKYKNKKRKISKNIKNQLKKPFSNKIFYLDSFFNENELSNASHCIVTTNFKNIFPRMICGNFYKIPHHYEVTHSFSVQKNNNDLINNNFLKDKSIKHLSYLPFVKPKATKLLMRVFPTNLNSKLEGKLYYFNKKKKKLNLIKKFNFNSSKDLFELKLQKQNKEIFGFMSLNQKNIPSRINASYIYSNSNNHKLTTDIALGFKSIEYPEKKTHWGSMFFGKKFQSLIMIRKIPYSNDYSDSNGELILFNNQKKEKIKISLKNYDYKIVDLLKVLGVPKNKKIDSASWILKLSGGVGVEVFWVTKNKNFICGDHSF